MALVALEAVPAGVRHRLLCACVSLRVRDTALKPQRRCLPVCHPFYKVEQEVRRSLPKLVRHMGSASACVEELSPLITHSAATSSIRLRVLVSGFTSASMAGRGC